MCHNVVTVSIRFMYGFYQVYVWFLSGLCMVLSFVLSKIARNDWVDKLDVGCINCIALQERRGFLYNHWEFHHAGRYAR